MLQPKFYQEGKKITFAEAVAMAHHTALLRQIKYPETVVICRRISTTCGNQMFQEHNETKEHI